MTSIGYDTSVPIVPAIPPLINFQNDLSLEYLSRESNIPNCTKLYTPYRYNPATFPFHKP